MNTAKGTNTTTTSSSPPSTITDAYGRLLGAAGSLVGSQPNAPQYGGNLVSGFTQPQKTAFQTINDAQGVAAPRIQQGIDLSAASANPIYGTTGMLDPSQMAGVANAGIAGFNTGAAPVTASDLARFQNPWTQDVVNATVAQMGNLNAQQANQLTGNAIGAGAYGGDRAGVAQGVLAGQQASSEAPVIAGLYSQGYGTSLEAANAEKQRQLAAGQGLSGLYDTQGQLQAQIAESDAARKAAAGYQVGQLGTLDLNDYLSGANAQIQSGALQQQLAQEGLNIPYEQWVAQQSWPYQQTQWLSNLVTGVGGASGGTSSTVSPGPSLAGQGIGAGLGIAGILGATGAFEQGGWFPSFGLSARRGGRIPGFATGGSPTGGYYPTVSRPDLYLPAVPDVSVVWIPAGSGAGMRSGLPNAPAAASGAGTASGAGASGLPSLTDLVALQKLFGVGSRLGDGSSAAAVAKANNATSREIETSDQMGDVSGQLADVSSEFGNTSGLLGTDLSGIADPFSFAGPFAAGGAVSPLSGFQGFGPGGVIRIAARHPLPAGHGFGHDEDDVYDEDGYRVWPPHSLRGNEDADPRMVLVPGYHGFAPEGGFNAANRDADMFFAPYERRFTGESEFAEHARGGVAGFAGGGEIMAPITGAAYPGGGSGVTVPIWGGTPQDSRYGVTVPITNPDQDAEPPLMLDVPMTGNPRLRPRRQFVAPAAAMPPVQDLGGDVPVGEPPVRIYTGPDPLPPEPVAGFAPADRDGIRVATPDSHLFPEPDIETQVGGGSPVRLIGGPNGNAVVVPGGPSRRPTASAVPPRPVAGFAPAVPVSGVLAPTDNAGTEGAGLPLAPDARAAAASVQTAEAAPTPGFGPADADRSAHQRRSFLSSPWLALAGIGAGMADSRSPSLFGAVGAGVNEGLKVVGKQASAEQEADKLYQEAQRWQKQFGAQESHFKAQEARENRRDTQTGERFRLETEQRDRIAARQSEIDARRHQEAMARLDAANAVANRDSYQFFPTTVPDPNDPNKTITVYAAGSTRTGQVTPTEQTYAPKGGANARPSVYEAKRAAWLDVHPGDNTGALDYASGRKAMSEPEINKAALAAAQRDASRELLPPKDVNAYVQERAQRYADAIRGGFMGVGGGGGSGAPAAPSAAPARPAAPAQTAPAPALPPAAAARLREGVITTFGNGQKWTLKDGKATQVQ